MIPWPNSIVETCDSTNDLARALGEAGAPAGTWISAREQTCGRGRRGNAWVSPPGNLYLSMVARIADPRAWTWVPLAAAVAVARAVESIAPHVRVRIKWPNDLWVEGRKLGGILCEGTGSRAGAFIVVGIGVNCAQRPDLAADRARDPWVREAVALADLAGEADASADALRPLAVEELATVLHALDHGSFDGVRAEYAARSVFRPGDAIEWREGGQTRRATVDSLGPNGELRARGDDGKIFSLLTGEVRQVRTVAQ